MSNYMEFLIKYFHNNLALSDHIYESMRSNDLSDVVVTWLNALKKNEGFDVDKRTKCNEESEIFRQFGNKAYKKSEYQNALQFYNMALLYAPKNSESMLLAYSNRSALLLQMKAYKACLNDIETCLTMKCPPDIIKKLNKRKHEASKLLWIDITTKLTFSDFSKKFFQLNVKRNAQIPCASTDVGVVMESNTPKIVAANDIKVGTVLALETAFISSDQKSKIFSCFYCQRISFNLIPCEGCCTAMFCSETCRDTCLKEYHNIECHIVDVIETFSPNVTFEMSVKFVLKMKNMSKSWAELISASNNLATDRTKNCSIYDIFDQQNQFSVLNVQKENHFIYGPMYNESLGFALIIYHLSNIPSYLPGSPADKEAAIRALARIMMFLRLFTTYTPIERAMNLQSTNEYTIYNIYSFGWFPLTSKLNHSCQPNVIVAGLNNKIALVALQPIQCGAELTISYMKISEEIEHDQRRIFLMKALLFCGVLCSCSMCKGDKAGSKLNNYKLTEEQKKYLHSINLKQMFTMVNEKTIPHIFPKVCKALTLLNKLSRSNEYLQAYRIFCLCLMGMQASITRNNMWTLE